MESFTNPLIEYAGITKRSLLPKYPIWFSNISICKMFILPEKKPAIGELLSITAEAVIMSSRILKTPEAVSYEGQMLEGHNLIIEILLNYQIRYISNTSKQNIHIAYFKNPVNNANVVLPEYHVQPYPEKYHNISRLYKEGKIIIKPYIENIYGALSDEKTIYTSIALFIDVSTKRLK